MVNVDPSISATRGLATLLPSTATRPISVLAAEVATSLVIIAPDSVVQGELFMITGQLTRVDTGGALVGEAVLVSYNGQSLGTPTTDMQGVYSIQAVIPETGNYTLTAKFEGRSGFMGSDASKGISISLIEPPTPWFLILGGLLVVGSVWYLMRRGK